MNSSNVGIAIKSFKLGCISSFLPSNLLDKYMYESRLFCPNCIVANNYYLFVFDVHLDYLVSFVYVQFGHWILLDSNFVAMAEVMGRQGTTKYRL